MTLRFVANRTCEYSRGSRRAAGLRKAGEGPFQPVVKLAAGAAGDTQLELAQAYSQIDAEDDTLRCVASNESSATHPLLIAPHPAHPRSMPLRRLPPAAGAHDK